MYAWTKNMYVFFRNIVGAVNDDFVCYTNRQISIKPWKHVWHYLYLFSIYFWKLYETSSAICVLHAFIAHFGLKNLLDSNLGPVCLFNMRSKYLFRGSKALVLGLKGCRFGSRIGRSFPYSLLCVPSLSIGWTIIPRSRINHLTVSNHEIRYFEFEIWIWIFT